MEISISEVDSKQQLLKFKLFNKDTCFVVLVSLIVIMSKFPVSKIPVI